MMLELGDPLSEAEVDEFFNAVDIDQDGQMSYNEFVGAPWALVLFGSHNAAVTRAPPELRWLCTCGSCCVFSCVLFCLPFAAFLRKDVETADAEGLAWKPPPAEGFTIGEDEAC